MGAFVNGSTMTKCYGSGTASDLSITWKDNGKEYVLTPNTSGQTFTPPEMANEPIVSWKSDDTNKYFHFLMVDPDAPTPQNSTLSDIIHCMILNIKGGSNSIYDGESKEPYKGPAPPAGSDPHHYCQFMFVTDVEIKYETPSSRYNFNTTAFEEIVNKTKGGQLQGSTYFMAQHV